MATKKYLGSDSTSYFWQKIKNALLGKVDKVDGKGLSSNDYTSDEKAKLANIAAGAEVNVNADWNATTGDAAILNKPSIPSRVSDLTNDSQFTTKTYVDDEIAEAIGSVTGIDFQVVSTLPATGTRGVIYLVSNSGTGTNTYDEYIWLTNRYEKIGTTDVDLSGYQLSAELVEITNAEIDLIVEG